VHVRREHRQTDKCKQNRYFRDKDDEEADEYDLERVVSPALLVM
jgi:hypothetical protein